MYERETPPDRNRLVGFPRTQRGPRQTSRSCQRSRRIRQLPPAAEPPEPPVPIAPPVPPDARVPGLALSPPRPERRCALSTARALTHRSHPGHRSRPARRSRPAHRSPHFRSRRRSDFRQHRRSRQHRSFRPNCRRDRRHPRLRKNPPSSTAPKLAPSVRVQRPETGSSEDRLLCTCRLRVTHASRTSR